MDVLSPQLMWINGSCYRINPSQETEGDNPIDTSAVPYTEEGKYERPKNGLSMRNKSTIFVDLYGVDDEDDYDIKTTTNGRFKTSFHVPKYVLCNH